MLVYLVGSLRNPRVPVVAKQLRAAGFDIFDDWFASGPIADDSWRDYEQDHRDHNMAQALAGIAAQHVYLHDKKWLDTAGAGILMMPAGKSGHLEIGYLAGQGKPTFALFEEDPERFDVMLNFLNAVTYSVEELITCLASLPSDSSAPTNPGLQYYKGSFPKRESSGPLDNTKDQKL